MDKETARVEAFSDGVFAIAITLLILEIKVPTAGSGDLPQQLLRQWTSYASFAISFLFIGVMWINHHRMFTHIRHCTDTLLVLNLLLLMGITAVPFPTALLAAHFQGPGRQTAALVYNGLYFVIAIFFNVLWRYAVSRGRLVGGETPVEAQQMLRQYFLGPAAYALCFAVAWVNVPASLLMNFALAIYFLLPPRVAASRSERHEHRAY